MDERRRAPRHRTLKGGIICFNLDHSVIDCLVRNMSEGGALLTVPSTIGIPDEFQLRIKDDPLHRNCRIVKRTTDKLHVEFR